MIDPRMDKVNVVFGSPFISKCIRVKQEYNDHSSIDIIIDNSGLRIYFNYYGSVCVDEIPELTWNFHSITFDDYDNSCNGCCAGCSEMHACHDLG